MRNYSVKLIERNDKSTRNLLEVTTKQMIEYGKKITLTREKVIKKLIKLKTENGIESINANEIMYSEAHGHYQYVILENKNQLRVRMTVTELYTTLMKCNGFIRVGSAYIINLRNIKNVSTSEVHLYNNITIPIPRGKHTEIKQAFWNFQYEE